jgi:hypothetical protein
MDHVLSIGEARFPLAFLLKRTYWVQNNDGTFVDLGEPMLKRRLNLRGLGMYASLYFEHIAQNCVIDFAGPLAGHRAGFQINNGVRCLVTTSSKLIKPKKGDFEETYRLLHNQLGDEQLPYVFSQLQAAMIRVITGKYIPIQATAFVGMRASGKNRIQEWIYTELLGGRSANPYQFMTNQSSFNEDLAEAEHLMTSDENTFTDKRVRDKLRDYVKNIAVNDILRIHPKGQKAHHLMFITLLTLSCNTNSRDLLLIPPLEHNVRDRLHLFYCIRKPMPVDVSTTQAKLEFERLVHSQLPALAYYLLEEWKTPEKILDPQERFPTKTYHHQKVLEKLKWISTEGQYEQIIDAVLYPPSGRIDWSLYPNRRVPWMGSAAELQGALCNRDSGMQNQVMRLASNPRQAGEVLSKLKQQQEKTCTVSHERNGIRQWIIQPPAYWNGAERTPSGGLL